MNKWIKKPLNALSSTWHRLAGRICFRLGSPERARRHFERVLQLRGDDFVAYLFLGRLAYSVGDYAGWRRELEHARRTSPERFARTKYPFDLFEPLAAGTLQDETGERATWRAMRVSSLAGPRRPDGDIGLADGGLGDSLGSDADAEGIGFDPDYDEFDDTDVEPYSELYDENVYEEGFACDDFSSAEERERLLSLPPIQHGEIRETDLDQLLEDLSQ